MRCRAAGMSAAMTRTPELHALQLGGHHALAVRRWRSDALWRRNEARQANFVQKTLPPRRADADVITSMFQLPKDWIIE